MHSFWEVEMISASPENMLIFQTHLKMQNAQLCLILFLWRFWSGFDRSFTCKQQINSSDYKMKIINISVLLQSSGIGTYGWEMNKL